MSDSLGSNEGWTVLIKKILQLKFFLSYAGAGLLAFFVAHLQYFKDPITHTEVVKWFQRWVLTVLIWLFYLIINYKFELISRTITYFKQLMVAILPIGSLGIGMYLLLFPLDIKKILGLAAIFIAFWLYLNHRKKKFTEESNAKIDSQLNSIKEAQKSLSKQSPKFWLGMAPWTATETTNEQGVCYKEVDLGTVGLTRLEFDVQPFASFWRAGIKLTNKDGSIFPLRSDRSFLFHIGSTDKENKIGITAYEDGGWIDSLNQIVNYDKEKPIKIAFEARNGVLKFYVNNKEYLSFKGMEEDIVERAYIAAWGDGNPYRVEFTNIGYY